MKKAKAILYVGERVTKETSQINITYSGNRYIFKGILYSVLSMLKHTTATLHIYVLTMNISERNRRYAPIDEEQIKMLNGVLKAVNADSVAEVMDLTDLYKRDLAGGKNDASSFTPFAQLRLFLDILPEIPAKILHVDADTMFLRDVRELYDVELGTCEYGAVLDFLGHVFVRPDYTNSGVMLLNMERIRETSLFTRARIRVKKVWMKMPDQSAIYVNTTEKMFLPRRYNEQRKIVSNTVIKHFCSGIWWVPFHVYNIKPWQRDGVHKRLKITEFDEIFDEYDVLMTEYGAVIEPPVVPSFEGKKSGTNANDETFELGKNKMRR